MRREHRDFWKGLAACRRCVGDERRAFFADKPAEQELAKNLCAECPVRLQCLEAGMDEDHGIWGGLNAKERKALRRDAVAS